MAKDMDDYENWLLPQFLIGDDDDDVFAELSAGEKRNGGRNGNNFGLGVGCKKDFAGGFGEFGFLGRAEGSTETEYDDDDYFVELKRKWNHSSLHESTAALESKMPWSMSGSPKSTLSGALGGGCYCIRCSSCGSPNSLSQVTSPTGMKREGTAWELLQVAAGEIARLRMIEEVAAFHIKSNNRGLTVPTPRKPSPVSAHQKNSSGQNLTHLSYEHQVKTLQFQLLRQQQISQEGQKKLQLSQKEQMLLGNGGRKSNVSMGASGWPTSEQFLREQQGLGSALKTGYLRNQASKRTSAGTGVFLPRRAGESAPASKKAAPPPPPSACSTALLSDRVVQALNLKLDSPAQPKYEAPGTRYRRERAMTSQQRISSVKHHAMKQTQEINLPREWTY